MNIGSIFIFTRLKHKMKVTLIILISLATAGFVWLMLMCLQIIPVSLGKCFHSLPSFRQHIFAVQIYISVILSASISFSCYPIFFEMTVEVTYPVHESIVGGFLTGFYNLVGIVFLLLFLVPNIGYVWINYVLVGATAVGLPAILFTEETYNRSNVDEAALSTNY